MTPRCLLDAIGNIRDEYVREADITNDMKTYHYIKWIVVAACIGFAVWCIQPVQRELLGGSHSIAPELHTYDTLNEFSTVVSDSVLDALARNAELARYDIGYEASWIRNDSNVPTLESAAIVLSSSSVSNESTSTLANDSIRVVHYYATSTAGSVDSEFTAAENHDVRSDYSIDGIEVQKFYYRDLALQIVNEQIERNPTEPGYLDDLAACETDEAMDIYWERININDGWYYVFARDEDAADSVMALLAYIEAES